jgi:CRP-like cAMP-binding protein
MSKERDFERFKNISLLHSLTEDEARLLFDICKRRVFLSGDIIIREGERGATMFFFISGEVEIVSNITMKLPGRRGFDKAEKAFIRVKAEEAHFLGEMSLFEDEPRSATIRALSDCVLYEIDRESFQRFVYKYPNIGVKILWEIAVVLSSRIRKNNRDILKLTTALSLLINR